MTITATAELEAKITNGDDDRYEDYWQLGLLYLLEDRELDAQATWFIAIDSTDDEEVRSSLIRDLVEFLDRSADRSYLDRNLDNGWLISAYIREFDPLHCRNLCRSIILTIELGEFSPDLLSEWQAIEAIESGENLNLDLLPAMLVGLLRYSNEITWNFIEAILQNLDRERQDYIDLIVVNTHQIGDVSARIELLTKIEPLAKNKLSILHRLSNYCANAGLADRAIETSRKFYQATTNLDTSYQLFANHTVLKSLLTAGNWQEIDADIDRHDRLLQAIITNPPQNLEPNINLGLLVANGFLPYLGDRARSNRQIYNQIGNIYLNNCDRIIDRNVEPIDLPKPKGVIRIGYLGSTLRHHSVGWLSRWLWQHHDRERFQIFTYAINQDPEDKFHQQWFRDRSDVSYCTGINAGEIAARIKADSIDILIDLDSLTLDVGCQVLALKPAPIQVTWLGWDATGIPTVDYFIADPYVVTDSADEYYSEKIYRLPSTYLAVDGFEVGEATLTRLDLNIPEDGVIYWTGQAGYKRHPDTIRLQLEIIKRVPNSYLLIKGISDRTVIKNLFDRIATEVGVSIARLRFIDEVKDESTHRANLTIADVVLDTFPYNGATTTLETLWMGVPMVTKVGEQFSARNSYTFMKNAGLEEGIAWSDEEYINWGVKLGMEPQLRADIHAKLIASRHTSDLWNAKKFTRQMEDAYRQMWELHQLTVES